MKRGALLPALLLALIACLACLFGPILEGDAIGRAGIGETFYRHQSPMPRAEALILKGLSDPELDVRAHFAKGTLVLRPFNATVRARLRAMAVEVPNAVWALSVEEDEE